MKTTTTRHLTLAALAVLAFTPAPAPAAGPVSQYYLAAGTQQRLLGVQGTSVVLDVAMSPAEMQFAIAVSSTVRTLGIWSGNTGGEYTLAGVPTGTMYANPNAGAINDGTTDGTYNYGWDNVNGRAFRFSATWTDPMLLFSVGGLGSHMGITYDATNNSLWLSGWEVGDSSTMVENYTMSGTLLSSFSTGHNFNAALALDPADNTLWLNDRNLYGTELRLEQFTKTGTLLQTLSFTGAPYTSYNAVGGEFAITVPEPGSALLLCVGGLGLLLRRRRVV